MRKPLNRQNNSPPHKSPVVGAGLKRRLKLLLPSGNESFIMGTDSHGTQSASYKY